MCAVSAVGDRYSFPNPWEKHWPQQIPFPVTIPENNTGFLEAQIKDLKQKLEKANARINELTKIAEEMKQELEAAKQQDIDNGTPDCEMESKVALIKLLAGVFNVDVRKVFP